MKTTITVVALTGCLFLAGCAPSLDSIKESAFEEVDQMSGLEAYESDLIRLKIVDAGDKASVEYLLDAAREGNTSGHERAAAKLKAEEQREAQEEAGRLAAEAEAAASVAAAERAAADLRAKWEPLFDQPLVLTDMQMGGEYFYDLGDTMTIRSDGTLEYSGRLASFLKSPRWELDVNSGDLRPCGDYCAAIGYTLNDDGTVSGNGMVFTPGN